MTVAGLRAGLRHMNHLHPNGDLGGTKWARLHAVSTPTAQPVPTAQNTIPDRIQAHATFLLGPLHVPSSPLASILVVEPLLHSRPGVPLFLEVLLQLGQTDMLLLQL